MNTTATKTTPAIDKKQPKGVLDSFQLFYEELPSANARPNRPSSAKRIVRKSKR